MKRYMDTEKSIELALDDAALVFRGNGDLAVHLPEPEDKHGNAPFAAIVASALAMRIARDPEFLQQVLKAFFEDPETLKKLAQAKQ